MKKLEAVINPFKLDEVREALVEFGVDGMTVTEVKGLGDHPRRAAYRGVAFDVSFVPQLKLEVVLPDERAAGCVELIRRRTQADALPGDAITVLALDDSVQIRTGEHFVRAA